MEAGGPADREQLSMSTAEEKVPGGKLVKVGDNTLTLEGANAHTGGTVISAGTLKLSGADDRLPASGRLSLCSISPFRFLAYS